MKHRLALSSNNTIGRRREAVGVDTLPAVGTRKTAALEEIIAAAIVSKGEVCAGRRLSKRRKVRQEVFAMRP